MNALRLHPLRSPSVVARTAGLLLLLLLPAVLTAQTVSVPPISATTSLTTSQVYFGKYVAHALDYGFIWVDTQALTAGYVWVIGKCAIPNMTPASNLWAYGDCNGISSLGISPDGLTLAVNEYNGQCFVASGSCSGPHHAFVHSYGFKTDGSWAYISSWDTQEGAGTQVTDPQGRTWTASCSLPQNPPVTCTWQASGNPNAPPTNNATAVNSSAGARTDKTNYFGDVWTLQDTSTSIPTISQAQWDFRYTTAFAPDLTETNPPVTIPLETHTFPFPCDPSAGGSIATGAGCWTSVGSPTTTGSYQFALQDTNVNGPGTLFISNSVSVAPPQISVAGFDGTTLNILTGGNADASQTQGNTANAVFNWTFNGAGYNCPAQPCKVVPVPLGTTLFSLQVVYPGGFTTPMSQGSVVPADLVPSFTLAPNPVLNNSTLTLTNHMQVSVGTTVSSVGYAVKQGSTVVSSGTLAGGFDVINGSAPVNAPGVTGNYTMELTYNYSGPLGSGKQAVVSLPFSSTSWAPNPQINISPIPLCLPNCQFTVGTAYSLNDSESILISPHPAAAWDLTGTQNLHIGDAADANLPVSWTPNAACNSGCTLKVTVAGVPASMPITISTGGPPPTNPSVSVSGPGSLAINQAGTFNANVTNAQGSVSYSWFFSDDPSSQSGGASMTHSWTTNGTKIASVTISASNGSASGTHNVSVTGNPAPNGGLSISPSLVSGSTYTVGQGQALTFTATEANAAQWGWNFGDGTLAGGATSRSVPKTYASKGTFNAQLIVYGDNVHNTGTTVTNFTVIVGSPLPNPAFSISGATQNPNTGNWDTEVGRTLTFAAAEPIASIWSWDFGDGTSTTGRTVTKTYTTTGARTVRLSVTGDGFNNQGTTNQTAVVNVGVSTFHAAIVPGVAHLDDGTTTWATDVSITNASGGTMTLNLAFAPLLASPPATQDLSQLNYGTPITLLAGGTYSSADVVSALNGGNNKGTLVVKYSAGEAPLVSTRVYFAPKVNPNNVSYGSGLPAYNVDATGRISPQGFTSAVLNAPPATSTSAGIEAVEDFGLTVTMAGTGTGTVVSDPAGISCPGTCTASFPPSTPVSLSGSADAGSVFVGIATCDNEVLGQCIMNMTGSKSVTATFNTSGGGGGGGGGGSNLLLSLSKSGSGTGTVTSSPAGINCNATCSSTNAAYASGTPVTLTATPSSGSSFIGWGGGGCSGTGTCVVTMSAAQTVTATFSLSTSQAQGDQLLIGLRSDPQYRFGVTLFNANSSTGSFQLEVKDSNGAKILISDGTGNPVAQRVFNIAPFQQVYLKDSDLGLDKDPNQRYVLRATRNSTSGTLLAFGTALDRKTNDLVQIADDSQASTAENSIVSYWVAGVSRFDTSYGAHWRTDLRIFNRGSSARNLYFDYTFLDGGVQHIARIGDTGNYVTIAPNQLLTYDDVIGTLMIQDSRVTLTGSTSGILRIYYPEDAESATKPLILGSRNYDDESSGTAGSQLSVYTHNQVAGPGQSLVLSGAQESSHFRTAVGVFSLDGGPVSFRMVAVAPDGTQLGALPVTLSGAGAFGQLGHLSDIPGFTNPGVPVSIRIDSVTGGRVGAYAFTVDLVTLDTNFIQALPQ